MRALLKKYGRYIGYALFSLLLIVYFSFLTFPYDAVKERYLAQQTEGMPYRVSINKIRATPFLWIRASGIDVTEVESEQASVLNLTEVRLRPSLLRLLMGRPAFRFKASLYGGKVKGRAGKGKETVDLVVDWKDIALAELPMGGHLPGAKLQGKLNGDMDLHMRIQGNRVVPGDGTLKARLTEGSAQNLQVQGIALPGLEGITGEGEITLAQNRATVDTLTLKADVLAFGLEGKMDIAPTGLIASPLNLKGKIKLSGALASQYQPMLSGFLRKQDKDGFYIFSIRGTLGSPRLSL
jgi:type II secretion system protein N